MEELLTRKDVEKLLRLSRSAIYDNMRRGDFPLPVKVAARAVRWRRSDLLAWIDGRPKAEGLNAEA